MTSRPRRAAAVVPSYDEDTLALVPNSTRKRKPTEQLEPPSTAVLSKKRAPKTANVGSLEWILTSDKSPLTSLPLDRIINESTWACLSEQDHVQLSHLLPPTAFPFFEPPLPTRGFDQALNKPQIPLELQDIAVEPSSFLRCPFFESAGKTFQDHLSSGWFAPKHLSEIEKYREGVRDASMHAPWKDSTWIDQVDDTEPNSKATFISLGDLTAAGDLLVYRRVFPTGTVIEKELLVDSVSKNSITVIYKSGESASLPPSLLTPPMLSDSTSGVTDDSSLRQMTVVTPFELENSVLDSDGRFERSARPPGNPWKRLTLWRWRDGFVEEVLMLGGFTQGSAPARGGRENRGTLFYLKGSFWDAQ